MGKPFIVRVGDLLREPGSRRLIDVEVEAERLETSAASTIPGTPLTLEGAVVAMAGGVEVIGTLGFDWYGACRRCLDDVTGHVDVALREIAQRSPIDDEIYPIDDDLLDLQPMVDELVLASLPIAPLCADDCPGPDPERFPTVTEDEVAAAAAAEEPPPDPRWAALSELRFDEG
ncbi:YceD family protein [Acidimicrobiia bacterium EGI L10123]|uniref:YceD family protein n=1 Tax=Salinilacustrithrix flava TaxID=2957203 RepID=UPI003D7C1650|nr:YceD family protein [Acidimicrobiia bacterium EGI L10123]